MPLSIKKKGSKFCVVEPNGKELGCHATQEGAKKQLAAIEISKQGKHK